MDKLAGGTTAQSRSTELLGKINQQPNFCECAVIGSRALADGNAPVVRYLTKVTDYFNRNNLQAEHQQIIFRQSGDNIGLMGTEEGAELFQEDLKTQTYHSDPKECLDGSVMRIAIQERGAPKVYEWLGYNCQAYTEDIKTRYEALKSNFKDQMCKLFGS